jgi:cGMP-dependent protein kinase
LGIKKTTGSGDGHIYETFDLVEKKQQKNDIAFIVMCLKMHFVFSSMSEH